MFGRTFEKLEPLAADADLTKVDLAARPDYLTRAEAEDHIGRPLTAEEWQEGSRALAFGLPNPHTGDCEDVRRFVDAIAGTAASRATTWKEAALIVVQEEVERLGWENFHARTIELEKLEARQARSDEQRRPLNGSDVDVLDEIQERLVTGR